MNPYIKGPIYRDNYRCKDKTYKDNLYKKEYDYKSLQAILQEELNKVITESQAKVIGDNLIDFLTAIYNDNSI